MTEDAAATFVEIGGRFKSGVGYSLLAAVFNQGSTLVVNVALARILGQGKFGEFALVLSTLLAFSSIFQFSLGFTATRFIAEFRIADREKAARILGFTTALSLASAIAGGLALLVSSRWLATSVLSSPQIRPALLLAALAVALNVINGLQSGILAGFESFRALARAGVATGCVYLIVCVVLGWERGLYGAVLGIGLSALVQGEILRREVRRERVKSGVGISFRNLGAERLIFTRFALPAAVGGFTTMPAMWCANALLVRKGGGYDQMALFAAAQSLRVLIVFLPSVVNGVGLSLLNSEMGSGRHGAYRRLFRTLLLTTGVLAIGGAAAVVLGGPFLIAAFGRDFRASYSVLLPLCAAAIFEAVAVGIAQIVQTEGRMWKILMGVALPRDLTLLLLTMLLVGSFGARGLAFAHAVSWLVALAGVAGIARLTGRRSSE